MSLSNLLEVIRNYHCDQIFNPYSMIDPLVDLPEASDIRFHNLKTYLEILEIKGGTEIWIGEALGHRGGKMSGVPFTDIYHLNNQPFGSSCLFQNPTVIT